MLDVSQPTQEYIIEDARECDWRVRYVVFKSGSSFFKHSKNVTWNLLTLTVHLVMEFPSSIPVLRRSQREVTDKQAHMGLDLTHYSYLHGYLFMCGRFVITLLCLFLTVKFPGFASPRRAQT